MKSEPLLENRFSYLLASDFDHTHSASMTLATCCATYSESTDSAKGGGAGQIEPRPPDGPSDLGPQLRHR
jgi:hypothetical protein